MKYSHHQKKIVSEYLSTFRRINWPRCDPRRSVVRVLLPAGRPKKQNPSRAKSFISSQQRPEPECDQSSLSSAEKNERSCTTTPLRMISPHAHGRLPHSRVGSPQLTRTFFIFRPSAPVQLLHVALQTKAVIVRYGLFIYGLDILVFHLGEGVLRCEARLSPEVASTKRQQVLAFRDIRERKKSANRVTCSATVHTSRTSIFRS